MEEEEKGCVHIPFCDIMRILNTSIGDDMKIDKNVYITEVLEKHQESIFQRISMGKMIPKLYCIVRPIGNVGLFEIYKYQELRSEYYKDKEIIIVGLAISERDAKVLLRRMVSDMYENGTLETKDAFFIKE